MSLRTKTLAILAAVLALTGCKDSNDYTVGVTKPLLVVSISPSNSADEVELEASIAATFSDDLDPETIDTSSFAVIDPDGAAVAGTVSYDAATFTATFDPDALLAYTGVYTVQLTSAIRRLEDGAVLAAPVETTFKTLDPPPLTIVATAPAASADNVDILTDMVVIFSEDVDQATLTSSTFFVNEGQASDEATQLPGTITYDDQTFTAKFTPDALELKYSQPYTITVDASVQSTRATPEGGQLGNDAVLPFKTYDPPPLVVVASAPTALGDDVAIGTSGVPYVMSATFSEPLNPGSIDEMVFTLEDDAGNPIMGTVSYTAGETSAYFTLDDMELPLAYSSVYTLRLAGTVESARATLEGGQIGGDVAIPFKTIDPPPLTLISLAPNDNDDDISVNLAGATAVFDRELDATSVDATKFTITLQGAGAPLATTSVAVDPTAPNQVILVLDTAGLPLAYTSLYDVFLDATIQAADATAEGGQLGVDINATFKTADPPPLTIAAASPDGQGDDVAVESLVQVVFDRAVYAPSVDGASFFLEVCTGTASNFTTCDGPMTVAATPSVPLADKAVLTPDAALEYDTFYRYTLTTDVKSADFTAEGGNLANTVTHIFHTRTTPPLEVVSVDPENGNAGVPLDKTIAVTFNAAVFESTLENDGNNMPNFYITSGGTALIPADSTEAAGVISLSADNKTAFLDPPSTLAFDTEYTVTVAGGGTGVTGQQGQVLPATFTSTFRTRINSIVERTDPRSDETGVDVDQAILVEFTTCMDTTTIDTSSFVVTFVDSFGRTVSIPGAITFQDTLGCPAGQEDIAVFTPALDDYNCLDQPHPLLYNTLYTVDLADTITTAGGAMLTGGYSWQFTTGTPPGVIGLVAENSHTSVDLLATSPADVPVNSVYVVSFDRDMDAFSIDTTTFFVNPGTASDPGTALAATGVIYDGGTLTATLTLNDSLAYGSPYTVTLLGGPGGVTDADGNFLEGDLSATFTSSPALVSDSAPVGGANVAQVNISVAVTLDRPVDPLTVTDATFQLNNTSDAKQLTGLLSVSPDRKILTFTPIPELKGNKTFEVRLTTGIRDSRGNPLSAEVARSFGTSSGRDATAPGLASGAPTGTAELGNVKITALFGEHILPDSARASAPVDPATDTVKLTDGLGNPIAGTMSYVFDNTNQRTQAIFTPNQFLDAGVDYTVALTEEIADLSAVAFVGTTYSFTVEDAAADPAVAPSFGSAAPGGGGTNIDADTDIVVSITDAAADVLRPTSANETTVQLLVGTNLVASVDYTVSGKTVVMNPPGYLDGGQTYTVKALAGGLKDSAGNGLAAEETSSFTVDAFKPMVVGTAHAAGNVVTLDIGDDDGVTVAADRVRGSSVTSSTVAAPDSGSIQVHRLDMAGGAAVEEVYGCLTANGATITWDPTDIQLLTLGEFYRVTVTPGVLDLGGLSLDQDSGAGGDQPFTFEFQAN